MHHIVRSTPLVHFHLVPISRGSHLSMTQSEESWPARHFACVNAPHRQFHAPLAVSFRSTRHAPLVMQFRGHSPRGDQTSCLPPDMCISRGAQAMYYSLHPLSADRRLPSTAKTLFVATPPPLHPPTRKQPWLHRRSTLLPRGRFIWVYISVPVLLIRF